MHLNYVEQPMERVLVIDDDVGLCELVGEYLEPEGYAVEAIHNGERGVDRALSNEHDLVVLDVEPACAGDRQAWRLQDAVGFTGDA